MFRVAFRDYGVLGTYPSFVTYGFLIPCSRFSSVELPRGNLVSSRQYTPHRLVGLLLDVLAVCLFDACPSQRHSSGAAPNFSVPEYTFFESLMP